ncbi:SWI/SNF-related matrix-associated actin-dependent regulator of chromatin subfamily A containing DEAD/H box 1 [Araneus ventricosus]|uniref:SWI/SNF-related matrix-associated actin-dependent regulator of chromatin subfamily A containing DEAD/H box 1 homolog n=1 Tax=Araneus ventricosus TaxID=182803 RepID=A0A4Y2JID4_ARAVE|nr:SWI/SNF-related matrix-associated actin-dependent regulator of chromatin subfamily A containing DEAD/H box 1 [Araneus ventricosus]
MPLGIFFEVNVGENILKDFNISVLQKYYDRLLAIILPSKNAERNSCEICRFIKMPGSCETDGESPKSVTLSLRKFRFQSKSGSYQPSVQSSPDDQNLSNKDSAAEVQDSTASNTTNTINLSQNNHTSASTTNQLKSTTATSDTPKYASFSPLSYRRYEAATTSQFLIPCITTKFQLALKNNNNTAATEVDLKLSIEELKKLKLLILQNSHISERWKQFVSSEVFCLDTPEKALKINRSYLNELFKFLKNLYHDNFRNIKPEEPETPTEFNIKTYSKSVKNQANDVSPPVTEANNITPTSDQKEENKGIMDEYEVFCGKEQNLRKLLDAFPGADIMEAQDILVKCGWDFDKALRVAHQQPLKCTKKRSLSVNETVVCTNQGLFNNTKVSQVAPPAEEIVLDSSDDEIGKPNSSNFNKNGPPPAKKARRRISSSESEEDDPKSTLTVKPSYPASKQVNCVQPKPALSNANSEKPFSLPSSLSIKPVPSSSVPVNNETPKNVAMPNLPKGLVILQVGDLVSNKEISNGKPATSDTDSSQTVNKPEKVNIPAGISISSTNNRSAQLVRIKPSTNGVKHSENSIVLPISNSVNVTPVSKRVSVTPVSHLEKESNVSDNRTSKSVISVSHVQNEPDDSDNSSISKLETHVSEVQNESNFSDIGRTPKSATRGRKKSTDGNKRKAPKSATRGRKKSNDSDRGKTSKSATPVSHVEQESDDDDNVRAPIPRASKVKGKKYGFDDDDDDEYGEELFFDSDDSDFEGENLTSAHSAVLKFFQEAAIEELLCIPGCSKKKAESLLNLRPFASWADLAEKLGNDKYLSTDLLNGAKKVIDMRNAITKLMTKCQQISFDMEDLVENLKSSKEESSDYVSQQPFLLNDKMHLTSYQMLGLNWLLLMHNQDVNGILADEMGLGKTVQAIAFLAYLKEISTAGPHLIVVPSSVLENWKLEFQAWWPDVKLTCYHGSQDSRRELRMQLLYEEVEDFDVMITTYNMVTSSAEDRGFFKRLKFHYVVFDEAHMLKNMASQRYQHLMKIKAPRRLLLTGTPLQNNLVELMSLLIFAMPHMFSGKTDFIKQMFSAVSKNEGNKNSYEKDRIEHAKQIMKPFVLRRLKKDVLQDLPAKTDEIKICSMSEDQEKKYADLVQRFTAEFESKQEKDPSSSGAGMMMQLRRAANHPLLLRRLYDDEKLVKMSNDIIKEPTHRESNPNLVFEDMSVMSDFELHVLCKTYKSLKKYALSDDEILNSGKFNILDSLLPTLIKEGHRILLFSQFTMVLDIVEEYMKIKSYKFLRLDGQVPVAERQILINQFNSDSSIFIFLLSTRAGGLGINLTAADTVILHDIDFNPYNDKQAEDRCHRVGQTKNVTIIRLISEGTIEEGILQRATEKLKLERDIHDEDETEEKDSASVAKLLRDALGLSAKSSTKS